MRENMMTVLIVVNGGLQAKRGVFAALGATSTSATKTARSDYLYFQDRAMFDEHLWRALQGRDCEGFDWQAWVAQGQRSRDLPVAAS